MTGEPESPDSIRVVLADANVLYSRVLRDYLLYAADEEVITIAWSARILDEVVTHLVANVAGFSTASGDRLVDAMNAAFPYAGIEPAVDDYQQLTAHHIPDGDDRHVLAAAVAAEATILCTANTRDFPSSVVAALGIEVQTPDALLSTVITEYPSAMLAVHATTVERLCGATNRSTLAALYRAGAPTTASLMARLIGIDPDGDC